MGNILVSSFSSKKPSFISLPPAPVFGSLSLSSSPSQRENPCDDSTPNSSGAPPSPCLLFYTAPSSPLTEQSPSPPITEQLSASFPQEEDQFPTADLSGALDVPLDDEALSALEKIYLFSRSDAAYHRVYISHALPEFLDHIEPAEATEYVLPLLRGLAMDSEDQVKEALAAELVPIIWWYFSHCQLTPAEDPRLELDPNAEAGPTPVSVQAFTPILGTLLLSPSGQIGGAARFAVVELLRRMRQADEHVAVASGLFGPNERELFRAELFEQVVIGMGRLDVDTGGDEDDQETQGQEQTPKEGQGELQSRRTPLTEPDNPYFPPLVRSHSEPPYFGRTSEFRPPPASPGTFPLPSPPLPTRQNANRPLSPPVEVPGRGEAINLDSDASEQAAVGRLSCMSLMAAVTASDALTEETKLAFVSELERIGRDPIYWVRREASFALGALAKVVPQEIVLSSLLPLFENLRQDSTWHVRHSALFALPAILSRLTASHRRTLALSIVPALSIDPAPSVRAGLLEALGEIIHTFFEDLTGPPETILRLFLGRREDKRVRDGRQSPRALAADVIHAMLHGTNKTPPPYDADAALDSFYTDPSRPLICAFNFPAVAQAMGPSRWGEIRHAYKDLTENRAVKVRRTLAASLGALAGVLGAEFTRRDLTKVWWDAIRAPEEEIRGKAIECMVAFVRALLSDGQGSAVGGELVGGLLTVWEEGVLRGWRERESAASALVGLAELVGEQYPRAIRGLLRRALEDGVAAVRETAVAAAPKIWRAYTHRPDVRAGLKEDVRALAVSSTARRRMGYAAVQLALLLPGKDGTSTCVPDADCWARLSTLAEDSVIDVRIGVARLAGAARTVLYKDGTGVPATLTNILQKLQRDPVGEVRAFVQGDEVNLDGGTFSRPPPVLRLQKRKKQYSNWQHKFSVHELEQALEGLAKGELQGH